MKWLLQGLLRHCDSIVSYVSHYWQKLPIWYSLVLYSLLLQRNLIITTQCRNQECKQVLQQRQISSAYLAPVNLFVSLRHQHVVYDFVLICWCFVRRFINIPTIQGFIKGVKICFIFCYFIFHRSTASQTSWRENFYSQPTKTQNKQSSSPFTKP